MWFGFSFSVGTEGLYHEKQAVGIGSILIVGDTLAAPADGLREYSHARQGGGVPETTGPCQQSGAPTQAVPLPFFGGIRIERLPANLLQTQRDYFGARTYERLDPLPGQQH